MNCGNALDARSATAAAFRYCIRHTLGHTATKRAPDSDVSRSGWADSDAQSAWWDAKETPVFVCARSGRRGKSTLLLHAELHAKIHSQRDQWEAISWNGQSEQCRRPQGAHSSLDLPLSYFVGVCLCRWQLFRAVRSGLCHFIWSFQSSVKGRGINYLCE